MSSAETKAALIFERMLCPPDEDARLWQEFEEGPSYHENNVSARLLFFGAFRKLITSVVEEYIDKNNPGMVVEVGSGTGFFPRFLAPSWLDLLCLDIDVPSLQVLASKKPDLKIFQASAYRLPLADRSVDRVIGYSSFDSFRHLELALSEAKRVLRPGGKLILFQDLAAELYGSRKPHLKDRKDLTVERYHGYLLDRIGNIDFKILKGRRDYLEGIVAEPMKDVRERVPDFDIEERPFPVLVRWTRGYIAPLLTRSLRKEAGITKEEIDRHIDRFGEKTWKAFSSRIKAGPGDLLEWVKMRYLVAQKPLKASD